MTLDDGRRIDAGTTIVAAGPWANDLLTIASLHVSLRTVRFEAAETVPAPFAVGPVV